VLLMTVPAIFPPPRRPRCISLRYLKQTEDIKIKKLA
jgi:hypothetical protein